MTMQIHEKVLAATNNSKAEQTNSVDLLIHGVS